ncbi:2-C-methyl-D-erythritol 4-phosphate cytidylyltransferase [Candidatus Thioglobus sp.]|uniref:2-C-methyl-D-erythritol 4-phosphate cytidylyltransferase n=1 Tax=Candidatus Thioglobus sp. TaxID=2026721 RepID=UPI003D0DCDEC
MSIDHCYLVVPASGTGSRMNAKIAKQYLMLDNGLSILDQTLKTLLNISQIKGCVIALSKQDVHFKDSKFHNHPKLLSLAVGGKQRYHSVLNALNALKPYAKTTDWVLVHDAARPCVQAADVTRLIERLKNSPTGGLLATKVVDTIKQAVNNLTTHTIDRSNLWRAQTPQMYRFGVLLDALLLADDNNIGITDEASAIEYVGLQSMLIEGSTRNLKITKPEDLALANFYLNTQSTL